MVKYSRQPERSRKVKKRIVSTICLVLCVLMIPITFISCGKEKIYTLGPYEITEDEYTYLIGMYKRRLLANLGYENMSMSTEITDDGLTLGQYLDAIYRKEFDMSIYTLLYAQSLFDDYGLTLTDEQKNRIETVIDKTVNYYGGYSEQAFKRIVKQYGYTIDTMRSVYTMQAKESAVLSHLYGDDYSKLTAEAKEDYYKNAYLHFQVIVINNVYKSVTDSEGKTSYINLSESEKATKDQLISELTSLLIKGDKEANYPIITNELGMTVDELFADLGKTYNLLFEKYSDDTLYPQGYYMVAPTSANQITTSNALSAAFLLKEGDCAVVTAKRYFEKDGTIEISGKTETIKAGDYFEYGEAFVRKLPLDDGAYSKEENKDFFKEDEFNAMAMKNAFYNLLRNYEKECFYELRESSLKDSYSIMSAIPNDLDYNFLYANKSN